MASPPTLVHQLPVAVSCITRSQRQMAAVLRKRSVSPSTPWLDVMPELVEHVFTLV